MTTFKVVVISHLTLLCLNIKFVMCNPLLVVCISVLVGSPLTFIFYVVCTSHLNMCNISVKLNMLILLNSDHQTN